MRRRAAMTLMLALTLEACGVALTHGPPYGHEQLTHFNCTDSTIGPILDIVVGTVVSVRNAALAFKEEDSYQDTSNSEQLLIGAAVSAIVMGVSSAIGFDKVAKCHAAKQRLAARQAQPSAPAGAAPGTASVAATVDSVVVRPTDATLGVGDTLRLAATAYGAGRALPLGASDFVWASSNDAIAAVSNEGLVRVHAPGTAVVTAAVNHAIGKVWVIVGSPR